MKTIILLFCASFLYISLHAQTTQDIKFNTNLHNFGKIKQGIPVTYTFHFLNESQQPLIIETATAECGCTKPTFPQTPINHHKKGDIQVTYNAAAIGLFKKNVYVKFANIIAPITLTIQGEVLNPTTSTH